MQPKHARSCAFHEQGAHAPSVWHEKELSNKGNTHQKMNREAKLTSACAAVACAIEAKDKPHRANVIVCQSVEELRRDVGNLDPKHPAEHGIAPML